MHLEVNYFSLAIVFVIAVLSPIIVSKIKVISIPEIIVQIIAGIIIGDSGLKIIGHSNIVDFLASFGFVFLMFLSGYEVNFNLLKRSKNISDQSATPLKKALMIMSLTLVFSAAFALGLYFLGLVKDFLLLTLIFSTTSLGIVVSVLKENGIIKNKFGQTLLVASLVADFSTLFLLPIVLYFIKGERNFGLLLSLLLIVAFIVLYFVLKLFKRVDFDKAIHKVTHLEVRITLAVLFLFAILSETIGLEVIIGAFMAGMLFSLLFKDRTEHQELSTKLDSIGYGFLIPIFFIMIGVRFQLSSVFSPDTLLLLPLFIIIVYLVKLLPSVIVLNREYRLKKSLSAGFMLSSRLSLIVAISQIALSGGFITMSTYSSFIIIAIVTCLISPIVSLKLYGKKDIDLKILENIQI
ncbi:cation:proton antiporter [Oscillospiraceae bacterium CM]|nr:cation:proton antiporter [Oscillospiraceae bacterium CM]